MTLWLVRRMLEALDNEAGWYALTALLAVALIVTERRNRSEGR